MVSGIGNLYHERRRILTHPHACASLGQSGPPTGLLYELQLTNAVTNRLLTFAEFDVRGMKLVRLVGLSTITCCARRYLRVLDSVYGIVRCVDALLSGSKGMGQRDWYSP